MHRSKLGVDLAIQPQWAETPRLTPPLKRFTLVNNREPMRQPNTRLASEHARAVTNKHRRPRLWQLL